MKSYAAHLVALFIALSYLGVLYLPWNKATSTRPRDHPKIIRNRLSTVCVVTAFWLVIVPVMLASTHTSTLKQGIALLGVVPGLRYAGGPSWKLKYAVDYFGDVSRVFLLVLVLFAGPVAEEGLETRDQGFVHVALSRLNTLQGVRDYVVGPVTEELVYRSCLLAVLCACGNVPVDVLIAFTPLYFGLVHLNHGWQLYRDTPARVRAIVIGGLFQLGYTWLFGAFATFVYLRTGNAMAVIVAHAFCNFFGFPTLHPYPWFAGWVHLYRVLLVAGLYGFVQLLGVMTKSRNELVHWH